VSRIFNTVTFLLVRFTEGGSEASFSQTRDETVYVIKGSGQMLINCKWVDVKPGTVHNGHLWFLQTGSGSDSRQPS